jgi:hypothetical protein
MAVSGVTWLFQVLEVTAPVVEVVVVAGIGVGIYRRSMPPTKSNGIAGVKAWGPSLK